MNNIHAPALMMQFAKATKAESKARVALIGPSGSGKTMTALLIAQGLAPKGRVAVIDTEHGSASKYAGLFVFDTLALETFSPDIYCQAIHLAEEAGYDVLIIDSLSHAWMGKDGVLEMVDRETARSPKHDSFAAWRPVTPKHRELIEAMLRCRCHLIATMRTKTEYDVSKNDSGKTIVRKIGLAPIQRDGVEYEFDLVADLDLDNRLVVSKSRAPSLTGVVIEKPTADLGHQILAWLQDGTTPTPVPSKVVPEDERFPSGGLRSDTVSPTLWAYKPQAQSLPDALGVQDEGRPRPVPPQISASAEAFQPTTSDRLTHHILDLIIALQWTAARTKLFLKRQTGKDRLEDLTPEEQRAILDELEALVQSTPL